MTLDVRADYSLFLILKIKKMYLTLIFTINVIIFFILITLNISVANNQHTSRRLFVPVFCIPR